MKIDVRTLYSALAVSTKVSGPNTLDMFETIQTVVEGTYHGVHYIVIQKTDPQVTNEGVIFSTQHLTDDACSLSLATLVNDSTHT